MTTEKNRRIDDIRPDAPLQWDDGKSSAPSDGAPRLRLGQIAERLGFPLTADFLRELGFAPVGRERASVLYLESDFQPICAALNRRIASIAPASADNPSTAGAGDLNSITKYVGIHDDGDMVLFSDVERFLSASAFPSTAGASDLKRYSIDCDGLPFFDNEGPWVAYDDFAASQAQPSAAEVRDQALEEAALACEAEKIEFHDRHMLSEVYGAYNHGCDDSACNIRALKSQSALGEKGGEDANQA